MTGYEGYRVRGIEGPHHRPVLTIDWVEGSRSATCALGRAGHDRKLLASGWCCVPETGGDHGYFHADMPQGKTCSSSKGDDRRDRLRDHGADRSPRGTWLAEILYAYHRQLSPASPRSISKRNTCRELSLGSTSSRRAARGGRADEGQAVSELSVGAMLDRLSRSPRFRHAGPAAPLLLQRPW